MKKIAIIGSGISGLSTAYHLHQDYDVTIFEKEDYLGGHTDTHTLTIEHRWSDDTWIFIFEPKQ